MFDRDDYYSVDRSERDDDFLPYDKVDKLKSSLEDLVDRFYHGGSIDESDFEEMDVQFRKMADILNVRIPEPKKKAAEYIEELIEFNVCLPSYLYKHSRPESSISYLSLFLNTSLKGVLTEKDIVDFCYSDFFKKKREEAKNVL